MEHFGTVAGGQLEELRLGRCLIVSNAGHNACRRARLFGQRRVWLGEAYNARARHSAISDEKL